MNNNSSQSGNQQTTASFVDVCEALKKNIMRSTNVAELVKVLKVSTDSCRCSILTNPSQIIDCIKLQNLEFQENDIALVVFTTTDFRTNLSKTKNNQPISTIPIESQTLHSKMYGVLIGLVYRK